MHTMTLTTVLTIVVIVRIMELTDLNCPLVTVKGFNYGYDFEWHAVLGGEHTMKTISLRLIFLHNSNGNRCYLYGGVYNI